MGCGPSKEGENPAHNGDSRGGYGMEKGTPMELNASTGIDKDLERAKNQEKNKVKLLLLGAGESGKSTVFKQMRVLYGAPATEDDQKMYGVIVRSNIITAIKKLCQLLRSSGMEEQLAAEPLAENNNGTGLTPKQAFDVVVAHVVDGSAESENLEMPVTDEKDWVGYSSRAKPGPNQEAKLFLTFWREIKTLWEVRL